MATSYQLVLDDTSPVVNYFPIPETLGVANLLAGWNSYFSGSGFFKQFGEIGNGSSMHVTGLDGAALTIQWKGTGISLFGSTFRSTYNVSVDDQHTFSGTGQDGLLADFQGLNDQEHTLKLVAHPAISIDDTSYVAFDRAVLNVTTSLTGANVFTEYIDVNDSTHWHLIGKWEQVSGVFPDPAPFQGFYQSTTPGNIAEIFFQASAVSVLGLRNTTTGHYNVTLDGITTTFDGHSDWLETSSLFLQTGLDENVKHALTITNINGPALGIAGLEVTHVQGGASATNIPSNNRNSSSSLSIGTILALVLAAITGLLVIGTLLLCMWHRKRERLRNHKVTFLAKPIRSDMYDVMGPFSSHGENKWDRDIEKEDSDSSALPSRREYLNANASTLSSFANVQSSPHLQPATTSRENVGVFPETESATQEEPDVNVDRERKVKSMRIALPTTGLLPEVTVSPGADFTDTPVSVNEMLDSQSRVEPSLHQSHPEPQLPSPSSPHKRSGRSSRRSKSSRPRSISLGQRPLSRLDIPESQDGTSAPSGSQQPSGLLITSPLGKLRDSRHSSLGACQSLSAVEEASSKTISTINFARLSQDSTFNTATLSGDNPRRPPPFPVGTPAGDLFVRLRAMRETPSTPQ